MRKNIQVIFVISTLAALVFSSACTMPPQENQTPQQTTSPQSSVPNQTAGNAESPFMSFEAVLADLPLSSPGSENTSTFTRQVYYVTAIDVDISGDARNWIFGVRDLKGTKMLARDKNGWVTLPWNNTAGLDVLPLESIISPGRLFARNADVIAGSPHPGATERRDLELKHGVYTVTITSGTATRTLTFNATTGEVMTRS